MAKIGAPYHPEYGVSWSDGNEPPSKQNPNPLPRGYYPVKKDGSIDTKVRLCFVDDAPGDPEDASGHFEVMPREAGYGYFHKASDGSRPSEGSVAPLEAHAGGGATIGAKVKEKLVRITYYFGGRS